MWWTVRPADSTRPGYTFADWYADEALTIRRDFGNAVTQDITLYATWTRDNGSGGSGAPRYTVIVEGMESSTVRSNASQATQSTTVTPLHSNFTVEAVFVPSEEDVAQGWSTLFSDISESDWHYNTIEYVYINSIMEDIGANTFAANTTTRSMIVTILYRYAQYKGYDITATRDEAAQMPMNFPGE